YIGPFMGLTTGKPDYGSGDGSVQSSYLGVYGTYVTQDGFYIDAIAKYASLRNHFSVLDSQSNQVSGTGRSDGFSLSLETGQRFNPTPSVKGLYLEPQAEFVYTHQNASNIHETNGLNVSLGSYESMVARASGILGYEVIDANNSVNVYLKTGILREFSGDTAYRLNGSREEHSFKGDWWNNGIGVSAQLNNAHTLYVDLDYSVGHKFDQRQVNGGYRFSF
ncbi:MAG: autotransporter outer membrane beta-barrel domain-containing protein, partial [Ewingella sp.]|nr:autotransporter outer membrane beta-barrel domain-containing protein [Ewingella sp.]